MRQEGPRGLEETPAATQERPLEAVRVEPAEAAPGKVAQATSPPPGLPAPPGRSAPRGLPAPPGLPTPLGLLVPPGLHATPTEDEAPAVAAGASSNLNSGLSAGPQHSMGAAAHSK